MRTRLHTFGMDHRWGHRVAVDLPIRVMHRGTLSCRDGRLSNFSLGGALIITALEPNVGASLQVFLTLPAGATSHVCVLDGYLVRRADAAIAIEWAEFAPPEVIDLVRAASFHSGPYVAAYASAA